MNHQMLGSPGEEDNLRKVWEAADYFYFYWTQLWSLLLPSTPSANCFQSPTHFSDETVLSMGQHTLKNGLKPWLICKGGLNFDLSTGFLKLGSCFLKSVDVNAFFIGFAIFKGFPNLLEMSLLLFTQI